MGQRRLLGHVVKCACIDEQVAVSRERYGRGEFGQLSGTLFSIPRPFTSPMARSLRRKLAADVHHRHTYAATDSPFTIQS